MAKGPYMAIRPMKFTIFPWFSHGFSMVSYGPLWSAKHVTRFARSVTKPAPRAQVTGRRLQRCHWVSKVIGVPRHWMVFNGKSDLEMDDNWGYPHDFETSISSVYTM